MTCLLVNISGLSGGTYDVQDHKFGLSKLLAATWTDIIKRQFIALLSPSGTLSHGLILSKGSLLPCSILRRILVTLSRKNGVSIGTPCHFVSQNDLFGTPLNKQFYKLACPI